MAAWVGITIALSLVIIAMCLVGVAVTALMSLKEIRNISEALTLELEHDVAFTAAARAGNHVEVRAAHDTISVDGELVVTDYKTGRAPGHKEVKTGLAPQLTLEAAILRAGGFGELPAQR